MMRLEKLDVRSVLCGLMLGAGGLMLLGVGPGENFPRFQLSDPWVHAASGDHGIYMIDVSNGTVTSIVGDRSKKVTEGP